MTIFKQLRWFFPWVGQIDYQQIQTNYWLGTHQDSIIVYSDTDSAF
jgi:hypothetical protein